MGVPLRTPDGVILGTVCLMDTIAHRIHAEDLAIVEVVADSVGRRFAALTRSPAQRFRTSVPPGLLDRDVLHALVAAELVRIRRDHDGAEIAMLETAPLRGREQRDRVDRVYEAAGIRRVAVADFAPGVLSLVVGAASWEIARARMEEALAAIQGSSAAPGVGVVSLSRGSPPLDAKACENLADELRVRSAQRGGALERVVLSGEESVSPRTEAA